MVIAMVIGAGHHNGFFYQGMVEQDGFHFPYFDAESPDFQLGIFPAHYLDISIRQQAAQITGTV